MIFSKVIKFKKEAYNTKFTPKGVTPCRLAAARKSINKSREKAGLFGEELMNHTDPIERINDKDKELIQRVKDFRSSDAKLLWECRAEWRKLSNETKEYIIRYWNDMKSVRAATPMRLASLLSQIKLDPLHLKRYYKETSRYTKTIVGADRVARVIEVSKEEYLSNKAYK